MTEEIDSGAKRLVTSSTTKELTSSISSTDPDAHNKSPQSNLADNAVAENPIGKESNIINSPPSPPSHHKLSDDVYKVFTDIVDDTVVEINRGIGAVEDGLSHITNNGHESNSLTSVSGGDIKGNNNYGAVSSSQSNIHSPISTKSPKSKSSRVLGPRDLVGQVEHHLEQEIINEASPLLHRLEEPLLGDDPEETTPPTDNDPLNTFSIRSLRIILYVLTALWSGWITLLIINVFAHVPWLDEPSVSSAFTQLDMALMSLAEVISSLMFYKFPAKADRGVEYVTAGIVLLDLVVVLAVPSQRAKNGSKGGLITTIGSLVTFILAPATDRIVEYTKKREEEARSADDYSPRRNSLYDYLRTGVVFSIRGLILLSVALISTNMVIETYDMAFLDPPGKIVPITMLNGTYSLNSAYEASDNSSSTIDIHIYCTSFYTDTSTPIIPNVTILVEAGESSAYEFSSWVLELYEKDEVHQVCYWDRPGFGFSQQAPSPVSAGTVANILFEALNNTLPSTSPSPKYALVSHGVGGLYSRIFASRHSSEIHSLVLVDSLHEDLFYHRNSPWQGFKYWFQGVVSSFGYRNAIGLFVFREDPMERVYGSAQQYQPGYFFAKLQEQLSARTTTKAEIIESNAALADDIPVLVISSSNSIRTDEEWSDKQRQLTKLTNNTLAWEVLEGPHELWKSSSTKKELQELLLDDLKYGRRS